MNSSTIIYLAKKSLVFLFVFLLNTGLTHAQLPESSFPAEYSFPPAAEKSYRVGVSLGYSFYGYREETDAPINRYLDTLTYIIDGNIEKGNFLHSLNIGFFTGKAEAKNPADSVYYYWVYRPASYISYRGNLEYALDYSLWGNQTFPGYLGGTFRIDAYVFHIEAEDLFSSENFSNIMRTKVTALASIGVHVNQKWIIDEENSLAFSASFPVLGYTIRPSFTGVDMHLAKYGYEGTFFKILTLGEIVSLHNYLAVFGDLKYYHKVNSLISLNFGLGFEYSRIDIPRPRIDALFRFNSGISFNF